MKIFDTLHFASSFLDLTIVIAADIPALLVVAYWRARAHNKILQTYMESHGPITPKNRENTTLQWKCWSKSDFVVCFWEKQDGWESGFHLEKNSGGKIRGMCTLINIHDVNYWLLWIKFQGSLHQAKQLNLTIVPVMVDSIISCRKEL